MNACLKNLCRHTEVLLARAACFLNKSDRFKGGSHTDHSPRRSVALDSYEVSAFEVNIQVNTRDKGSGGGTEERAVPRLILKG
jgi:hypothetical protein